MGGDHDLDQRTGFGTMVYPDGAEFSGIWANGVHKEFRESRDSLPTTTTTTEAVEETTMKRRRRKKKKVVKGKGKRIRGKPGAQGGRKRQRKQRKQRKSIKNDN